MTNRTINLAEGEKNQWVSANDMVFAGNRNGDAVRVFIAIDDWDRFVMAHEGQNSAAARADLARIASGAGPTGRAPDGVYEFRVRHGS